MKWEATRIDDLEFVPGEKMPRPFAESVLMASEIKITNVLGRGTKPYLRVTFGPIDLAQQTTTIAMNIQESHPDGTGNFQWDPMEITMDERRWGNREFAILELVERIRYHESTLNQQPTK